MLYFRGGGVLEKNEPRGMELLARSCKLGSHSSCFILGMRLLRGTGAPKDEALGREILQQACVAGEKNTCNMLAGSAP